MSKEIERLIESKKQRKNELRSAAEKSEDVKELRGMNEEMERINGELKLLEAALKKDEEQEERTKAVNIPGIAVSSVAERNIPDSEDNDIEYRRAFKDFIGKGTPIPVELQKDIPAELRANATTKTSDVGAVIPIPIINQIIQDLETIGMIIPLVNKTSFPAGFKIPTASIKPTASWVLEGAGSDRQKATVDSHITFTFHKLRCEIAWTQETDVMTLSVFEATFVKAMADAITKAIEQSILTGDGTSQPKGILTETPKAGQELSISALSYTTLTDSEAALPQAYEGGAVWVMTKRTFMAFAGMLDENNQPVARINYGIAGKPERTLLGRTVVLCGDYMQSFSDDLADGEVFAFLYNFKDYTLNTNYNMGVQQRQDWDTEDIQTKIVMAVDGKATSIGSLVVLKKETA